MFKGSRVVRSIIDALEEQFYPPEEIFREEFLKSVEKLEKKDKSVYNAIIKKILQMEWRCGSHERGCLSAWGL